MTLDEIKSIYSMRDIISRYGIEIARNGFIKCPFHNDHHASMKIYDSSFHCFSCKASGDVVKFVQLIDGMTFKDAFYSLGGTYDKAGSYESKLAIYKAKIENEKRLNVEIRLKKNMFNNLYLIDFLKQLIDTQEPLSDEWCDSINALSYQLYLFEHYRERGC